MNEREYRQGIVEAYDGELGGVALCEYLLPRFRESSDITAKLEAICKLERHTSEVLWEVVERHKLNHAVARPDEVEIDFAKDVHDWSEFVSLLCTTLPPFVEKFDQLAEAALPDDADALTHLAWHERALVAFAEAEHAHARPENVRLLDWGRAEEHAAT
jgi:hypothetical protein